MNDVQIPKWLWGVIATLFISLLGGTGAAATWVASNLVEVREQTALNRAEISHVRDQYQRIEAKLDRLFDILNKRGP